MELFGRYDDGAIDIGLHGNRCVLARCQFLLSRSHPTPCPTISQVTCLLSLHYILQIGICDFIIMVLNLELIICCRTLDELIKHRCVLLPLFIHQFNLWFCVAFDHWIMFVAVSWGLLGGRVVRTRTMVPCGRKDNCCLHLPSRVHRIHHHTPNPIKPLNKFSCNVPFFFFLMLQQKFSIYIL